MKKLLLCIYMLIFIIISSLHGVWAESSPSNVIYNSAYAYYKVKTKQYVNVSNTIVTNIEYPAVSEIQFMHYVPNLGKRFLQNGEDSGIRKLLERKATEFYNGSTEKFEPLECPKCFGIPIEINQPVLLVPARLYYIGEPIFILVKKPDQNRDSQALDCIQITISVGCLNDKEILRLMETGPNTGEFIGSVQTCCASCVQYNGVVSARNNAEIIARYVDLENGKEMAISAVLEDPYGIVFDSITGLPINGVSITLLDKSTSLPAEVFGDDGVSNFPATLQSGGTVSDSSGREYLFPPGGFWFPFVKPGNYQFVVNPPKGYSFPSDVEAGALQIRPGNPFEIKTGSYGEVFQIEYGLVMHVDIPLDIVEARLFIQKTPSRFKVAPGDFLQYKVSIENLNVMSIIPDVEVKDFLPLGFHYNSGSTRINGEPATDPDLSADGLTLKFSIGDMASGAIVEISYVVEVAAGTRTGKAENHACATGTGGVSSNFASATVEVREDFMRHKCIIVGQVTEEKKDRDTMKTDIRTNADVKKGDGEDEGIEGIRIYLEDGTYVVTDQNGMFHFEGVEPGVHVIQLDIDTLPEKYQSIAQENDRFAGCAYSQFVDLQGGTMWRADFKVGLKPPIKGQVNIHIIGERDRDKNNHNFTIPIECLAVPINTIRLMVIPSDGIRYQTGHSFFDGVSLEPEIVEGVLTFRLGDIQGNCSKGLSFTADVDSNNTNQKDIKVIMLFNTPTAQNQRTPLAEISVGDIEGTSEVKVIETTGLPPGISGETLIVNDRATQELSLFDDTWFETAEPGFEWLFPEEGYLPPIPSLKVAIKHYPEDSVTLFLEGKEVDPLSFDTIKKNKEKSVAVSIWRGIDLREGDNHFEVIVHDANNREARRLQRKIHYSDVPVKAELVLGQSSLVADGKNPPMIAIRLIDKDGYNARESIIGEFTVDAPYSVLQDSKGYQNVRLSGLNKDHSRFVVEKNGIAVLKLQPTPVSGKAVVRIHLSNGEHVVPVWLKPAPRDWILVGLAEGTIGYTTIKDYMEGLDQHGIEENLYKDGRVAFFGKGRIKGEWLLTVAYDSEKNIDKTEKGLYQIIDPDTYYTLYGDATQQSYEAPSLEKLYLKIERNQFYTLFGDFDTGLTITEFSHYNRSLNGVKTEIQKEYYSINGFVSATNQGFIKDEIRGNGTSGLYYLTRTNILANSEKIYIQARDRFRTEIILSSDALIRHFDYTIDYEAGILYFKHPVMSKDDMFNPVFIVVDYESYDNGDTSYNYGGRAAVKLLDKKVEVGTTHIHEGRIGSESNLYGLDVTYDINKENRVKSEIAYTDGYFKDAGSEGGAYLVEVIHYSEKLDGRVYLREQKTGFGLGQQNSSESGKRKIGIDVSHKLTDTLTFKGDAYQHSNLANKAERDVLEIGSTYEKGHYLFRGGLLMANDRLEGGGTNRSNQITAGSKYRIFQDRLNLSLEHYQPVGGYNNTISDFPRRTIIGADLKLNKTVTLFGSHEITQGETKDSESSVVGIKGTPWNGGEVNTSLEHNYTENGPGIFANFGLHQTWKLNMRWSLDGSLDRTHTIRSTRGGSEINSEVSESSGSNNDFTALSLGTAYTREKWSCTYRIERFISNTEKKWGLFSGIVGEPRQGLGMSLSAQVFDTKSAAGLRDLKGDIRLDLAYRPIHGDWIVLNRLDFLFENEQGGIFEFDKWRIVNNLNANYRYNEKMQITLQYGSKYIAETIDQKDYYGYTDLASFESRYDINKMLDIGLRFSVLHSWNSQQFNYSYGPSIGYTIYKNIWMSIGYNVKGFTDKDFSLARYTACGPYIQFCLKIDQSSIKEIMHGI